MQCSYPQGISVARRSFSIWMAPEHEFEILFLAFAEESFSLQRELATYTFPLSLYAAAAAQTESGLGTTQCIKRGQFAWHKHLLRSSSSSSSSNSYYESSVASIVHHVLQTFKRTTKYFFFVKPNRLSHRRRRRSLNALCCCMICVCMCTAKAALSPAFFPTICVFFPPS